MNLLFIGLYYFVMIDAVITYVNMNDPIWIKQYKKIFNKEPEARRFKEFGTIELQILSIRKYMPWVRNIYVVVSTESQLSTNHAIIITHDKIIPKEYLPTFNSCTIELFLHNIPGLSDYFIYFNDDIFPINYCGEDMFFNGKPILSFKTLTTVPENIYRQQCKNGADLARKLLNKPITNTYIKPDHICLIHSKRVYEEIWGKAKEVLENSITLKREPKNINQYVFVDYLYYSNKCDIKRLDYIYIQTDKIKPNDLYWLFTKSEYDLICIHDNADDNEKYYNMIKKGLKQNLKEQTIDLVVPYVDNRDPEWQKNYNIYVNHKLGYGGDVERFRSYDLFKYFFRGIDKYMKFIRKVHLIVSSESQIPDWINKNTVHIVTHDQFIPKEYLPVFNSCTIEMFLHNIPDLNDRFIYANDDIYANNPMEEDDFFEGNTPKFGCREDIFNKNWNADYIRYNIHKLVTGNEDRRVERIQHVFIPYLKSTIESCNKIYKHQINNSITRVRDSKNLSQWLYAVYQARTLKFINHTLPHSKSKLKSSKAKYINDILLKAVCLNDSDSTTIEDVKIIDKILLNKFPNKSKYEL